MTQQDERPEVQQPPGLDPFIKRYLFALVAVAAAVLLYTLLASNPRVDAINDKLAASPIVSAYPYPFRVLSLKEGVAVMTSPRSAEVGPLHFLRILDPSLTVESVTSEAMMSAQDAMAQTQAAAAAIVKAEEDVDRIVWELDEKWYAEQGVFLPDY